MTKKFLKISFFVKSDVSYKSRNFFSKNYLVNNFKN